MRECQRCDYECFCGYEDMTNDSKQQGARKLLRCPFCNGTNTQIRTSTFWTGMRNEIISATVMHWCDREPGQLESVLQIKAKTEEEAAEKWNRRPAPPDSGEAR